MTFFKTSFQHHNFLFWDPSTNSPCQPSTGIIKCGNFLRNFWHYDVTDPSSAGTSTQHDQSSFKTAISQFTCIFLSLFCFVFRVLFFLEERVVALLLLLVTLLLLLVHHLLLLLLLHPHHLLLAIPVAIVHAR